MELQYCNEHGIAHSKFLNWSADDRGKALAYMIVAGERCQLCGTSPWEWEEDRFAYEPVEQFCHGCYQKEMADDNDPNRNKAGITMELLPTRTIEAAKRLVKAERRYERRDEEE